MESAVKLSIPLLVDIGFVTIGMSLINKKLFITIFFLVILF